MSNRLNQERETKLQPKRIEYAKNELKKLGITIKLETKTELRFLFNENEIKFFPYSGWYQGKGIIAGRGIEKLLKQLKNEN